MRFGQLTSLDYAVSRPFPWRWFGGAVFAASGVIFIFLTVLNFATVGHEPIATVSPLFFNASKSWSTVANRKDNGCQAHLFLLGDTFYTNVSAYPYRILSIAPPTSASTVSAVSPSSSSSRWSALAPPDSLYGFVYRGEELGTACYDSDLTKNTSRRLISIRADASKLQVTGSVRFFCDNPGSLVQLELSHTTSALSYRPPAADYSSVRQLETQVATFGLRDTLKLLVDGFAMDLLAGMHLSGGVGWELDTLSTDGYMTCVDESGNSLQTLDCTSPPELINLVSRGTLSNGTANLVANFAPPPSGYTGDARPQALVTSISNYIAALHSATLADLGVPSGYSMLRSGSLFNASVAANDRVTTFYTSEASSTTSIGTAISGESIPTIGIHDLWTLSTSFADYLRANPTLELPGLAFTPAIIGLNFFCNELKLKKTLNLIVSIGVANISIFTAIWAGFMFVAVAFARRNGGNSCQACASHTSYTAVSDPHQDGEVYPASPLPKKESSHDPFFNNHVA